MKIDNPAMEHYVTLFDSFFLPQGLALHASMERHAGSYTLWVLCMDEAAHDVLTRLRLPNLKLLALSQLETPELLAVKPGRTRGEYCWTLTPFSPRFVFEAAPDVERVTYLDADLWFRKNPAPIFREFAASGKGVQITDHAYAPEYDSTVTSGQFCVQFMTFHRQRGEAVRKWWEARCLEWCFARYEDGKFGDQKYLDDWQERFPEEVHVLVQKELLLAPWNVTRFPYGQAVVYHFQGLRILAGKKVVLAPTYSLPRFVVANIYEPYLRDLRAVVMQLERAGWEVLKQSAPPGWLESVKPLLGLIVRNFWRVRLHRVKPL
ncbi:MAG: glycosyl transferase [Thiobacillus sp.]|nr:glycosyl transferase [Thiobacillus sp.]